MRFSDHRKARGLTLAQTASELGLSQKSVGWLSEIENGKRDASLRLALRIERWSGGEVTAASVCRELADHDAPSVDDAANLTRSVGQGAGKTGENVSRTAEVSA